MVRYYPAKSNLPSGYDGWDDFFKKSQQRTAALTQAYLFGSPTGQSVDEWRDTLSALPVQKHRAIVDQIIGMISGEGNPVIRLATANCVYQFELDHLSALMIRCHLDQAANADAIDQRAEELKESWR